MQFDAWPQRKPPLVYIAIKLPGDGQAGLDSSLAAQARQALKDGSSDAVLPGSFRRGCRLVHWVQRSNCPLHLDSKGAAIPGPVGRFALREQSANAAA